MFPTAHRLAEAWSRWHGKWRMQTLGTFLISRPSTELLNVDTSRHHHVMMFVMPWRFTGNGHVLPLLLTEQPRTQDPGIFSSGKLVQMTSCVIFVARHQQLKLRTKAQHDMAQISAIDNTSQSSWLRGFSDFNSMEDILMAENKIIERAFKPYPSIYWILWWNVASKCTNKYCWKCNPCFPHVSNGT